MVQLVNAQLVDNLKPFFPTRREWNARAETFETSAITSIVAGAGLGGGGSSGAVTVYANAGDGIAISTDNIVVDLASPSGLSFATGQLQIDDSIAGSGLSIAGKVLSVTNDLSAAAGDGLSWDAGNSELDVNVGDGLAISADNVVVDLAATSGLSFTGGDLQLDDSVAGDGVSITSKVLAVDLATDSGLTFSTAELTLGTPGTLSVSSSNTVSTSTHAHAVTSSSNPGAASSLLASDASGYLSLQRLGIGTTPSYPLHIQATDATQFRLAYDASNYVNFATLSGGDLYISGVGDFYVSMTGGDSYLGGNTHFQYDGDSYVSMLPGNTSSQLTTTHSFAISPTNNLTLSPTANVYLDPTSDDVLPGTGYEINLGAITDKFLTLHAAELWVETLVAQNTIATIGGRILVGPTTKLIADRNATVTAGSNLFGNASVESWAGGAPVSPWSFTNNNGIIQTSVAHAGSYSALMFPYNNDPATRLTQIRTVSTSTQYKLSFWMYTNGIENSKPRVDIYSYALGSEIVELSEVDVAQVNGEWVECVYSFMSQPDATNIRFEFYAPAPVAVDNAPAYICGVDTDVNALDSQGAYIEGDYPDGVSSKAAYIEGYGSPNTKSAYIEGAAVPWVLLDDFSLTSTNYIDVEHNQMVDGDIAYMEADGKVEFFKILGSPATISGGYRYGIERNLDGSGANVWYAGDAVFNTGTTNDGFIDLYSLSGVTSGTIGPTIVGNVRNSNTYNDWTERWAIGNLNGIYGYLTDTYGVALGDYTGEHVTIEPVNGIRFFDSSSIVVSQWDSSNGIRFFDSSANLVSQWDSSGISLYGGTDIVINLSSSGDATFGKVADNNSNVFWNSSNQRLEFRAGTGGTTVQSYIDTTGSFVTGGGDIYLDDDGISIKSSLGGSLTDKNYVRFFNDTDTTGYLYGYHSSGIHGLYLQTKSLASEYSIIHIGAVANTTAGYTANIELQASDQTGSGSLSVYSPNTYSGNSRVSTSVDELYFNGGRIIASDATWCWVQRSTDQSVSNGGSYTVSFESQSADTDNMWSSGTQVAPNTPGVYWVMGEIEWQSGVADSSRQVYVEKNGSVLGQTREGATSGVATIQQAAAIVDMNGSTDYFTLTGKHNNGSSLNIQHAELRVIRIA